MDATSSDLDAGLLVQEYPAPRRSLRVAFVTETYPPEVNGVAMTLAHLVQGLHKRNHDVQLIRPRQPGSEACGTSERFHEVLMRGLPVPRYPSLRMGVPSKRALVRLWSFHRPDIVHIATEGPLGWSALKACEHLKLPVTSDFRTNFHAYSQHYGVGWLRKPIMAYLRKFHNAARRTFVPTDDLRQELADCGFQRLRVVSRGVDTEMFNPLRRDPGLRLSWGLGPEGLAVLYMGRLAAEKNLELLVRAFDALAQQVPDARMVLVGNGPMRHPLQLKRPQFHFAGQRSGEDLARHVASADLFLFPSLSETFGNVVTESMASGVPVVAFDHAAAGQLIRSGVNGQSVPRLDEPGFIRAVVEAAQDRQRLARWGQQARRTVEPLGWPDIVQRFEAELREALDHPLPPGEESRRPAHDGQALAHNGPCA
ncbi:MAG: glycosyltransferase family 1 protein [Rubrivivax sp.]|jgi:glycosyltransferase involved in cell wall biosynthesis|nr:glycosyltransferase family 1 protein [Rubrivivax sp.]